MKKYTFLLSLLMVCSAFGKNADMVIFSYNRPMQLYALLESTRAYIKGLDNIFVVYRASDAKFENGYQVVKDAFPKVSYFAQGDNPKQDFKPLTLKAFNGSKSEYIVFAVDDIIIKDHINIDSDLKMLKKTNAYGMYYRLGKNLTRCYPYNCYQPVPRLKHVQADVYKWNFRAGKFDWNYPHSVDMTLFKKSDIRNFYERASYWAPNQLEGRWSGQPPRRPIGICHAVTKMVNLPLNLVQEGHNRNSNYYSPEQLLEKFNSGLKMDIKPLFKINNPGAHMDYRPTFVKR